MSVAQDKDLGEAPCNWSSRISQMACTCNSLHVILLTSLHLQLTWSPFSPSVQHNICCVLLPQLHLVDKGFFRCNSFWNIGCPLGSVVSTTTGTGDGDEETLWGRGQGWWHSLGQGLGWGHSLGQGAGVGALSGAGARAGTLSGVGIGAGVGALSGAVGRGGGWSRGTLWGRGQGGNTF